MSAYFEAITAAMTMLAEHPKTLFIGQAVAYPGQIAFKSFEGVPMERRIELPVVEDFQMGLSHGLALQGYIPVSFYPRWDFLCIAANQLINHLDKSSYMGWSPKVIIRTAVGRSKPLDPGPQHTQNHSHAFRQLLTTVNVLDLSEADTVLPAYRLALNGPGSFILVERQDRY